MNNKKILVIAIASALLVACSQAVTPKKVSANKDYKLGAVAGTEFSQKVTSQVDVLFVVDDSGSMEEEQQKLKQAIPAFIKSLGNQLDWQVAVTRSWDDSNGIAVNGKDRTHLFKPVKVKDLKGERDMVRGELLPVLNPNGGELLKYNNGRGEAPLRFVRKSTSAPGFTSPDSEPDYHHILSSHLLVGFRGYPNYVVNSSGSAVLKGGKTQPLPLNVGWGPQYEVMMDVAREALTPTTRAGKLNQGFFRPGSRLVLVFLTDAPDASGLEVNQYAEYFKGIAHRNVGLDSSAEQLEHALTVYGILPFKQRCAAGESTGDMDPDIAGLSLPRDLKVYQLVEDVMGSRNTSSYSFDICSKKEVYASKMRALGDTIRKSSKVYVQLKSGKPDNRLKVWFGRGTPGTESFVGVQLVNEGYNNDWYYKAEDGKEHIVINPKAFDDYGLNTMAGEVKITDYYPEQKAK